MKNLILLLAILFNYNNANAQTKITHSASDTQLIKVPTKPYKSDKDDIQPFLDALNSKWEFIGSSNNKEDWYVYDEYISKNEGLIKIWIKGELPITSYKNRTYKNVQQKQLVIFNCEQKKYSIISDILYNNKGSIIYSNELPEDYEYIIPDSIIENISASICEKYN